MQIVEENENSLLDKDKSRAPEHPSLSESRTQGTAHRRIRLQTRIRKLPRAPNNTGRDSDHSEEVETHSKVVSSFLNYTKHTVKANHIVTMRDAGKGRCIGFIIVIMAETEEVNEEEVGAV